MYLAKIKTDTANAESRRVLSDRQNIHSEIQKMFSTDRKTSNVLYRINGSSIYISADKEPVSTRVFDVVMSREMDPVDGIHKFSIVTIPRKCIDRKKYVLRSEEERINWMHQQAEKNGFVILSIREVSREPVSSRKKGFKMQAYCYEGLLKVTDTEKFEKARSEGIGTMKAYGCGMLLIR